MTAVNSDAWKSIIATPANIWHCPVKNETLYSHGRPFTEKPQRDTYIKFMD
jgi:hypothetical protein